MLGLAALAVAAFFALGLHDQISGQIQRAICTITSGTDCGTPGPGSGYADDPYPDSGRADRAIYDDECQGDIPDDASRAGDDGAVGNDQVDRAYENLGRVYDYYLDTFGYDSYDGAGAQVVGVVNSCDGRLGRWRVALGRRPRPVRARRRRRARHRGARVHARRDGQHGGPRVPVPVGRAERVDLGHHGLEPGPRGPDLRRGPRRRRRDPDCGTIRDYSEPGRFGQPTHVDDYVASPNDRFGDWGGVHTNSGHPEPRLLRGRPARRARQGRADRLARADRAPGARLGLRGLPQRDARVGRASSTARAERRSTVSTRRSPPSDSTAAGMRRTRRDAE